MVRFIFAFLLTFSAVEVFAGWSPWPDYWACDSGSVGAVLANCASRFPDRPTTVMRATGGAKCPDDQYRYTCFRWIYLSNSDGPCNETLGEVWNQQLQKCDSPTITCTAPEVLNPDTSECEVPPDLKCPTPFWPSLVGALCEAYCATSETWDPIAERCIPPPQEQNCKTQGKFPIDFIAGRKYRSEPVLRSGVRYPFSLTYYFNNHRSQEKSPVGSKVAVVNGDRYLAATKPPMTASEYQAVYTNRGAPKGGTVYRESQHYGSVDQYWRHNFDEVLLIQGNQYLYQSAKGEEIIFNGLGSSAAYPSLVLEVLASGEESFGGYKLTNRRSSEIRKFDENGRLIKLERSLLDVLVLTYDSQNCLDRITNSEGALSNWFIRIW